MVTQARPATVEAQEITLEQLGEIIGIPIKVKPLWGSIREGKVTEEYDPRPQHQHRLRVRNPRYRRWVCPLGNENTPLLPVANGKVIVVYSGRCGMQAFNKKHPHGHRQDIKVLEVDRRRKAMLVDIEARGAKGYTRGLRVILGVDDGSPFVVRVIGGKWNTTLDQAFQSLKPNCVKRAEAQGLDVKRQGDWFFIPVSGAPSSQCCEVDDVNVEDPKALRHLGMPTRHYAEEIMCDRFDTYVRGIVNSPQHGDLYLETWHEACRNWARREWPGGD